MTAVAPRRSAWLRRTCGLKLAYGATLALGAAVYAPRAEAGAFATARYTGEHGHPTTDNATALYFNPGALTRGEGTRLLLDGSLALRSVTWVHPRHPTDDAPAGYEDANAGKAELFNVLAAPTLGIVGKLDALAIGGLIHVPFGGAGQFDQNPRFENDPTFAGPVDGVQRWHNITGSLRSVYFTIGAAYELADQFSFGLALNLISSATETVRAKNAGGGGNVLATEGRAALLVEGFQWSFGAGVLWEPVKDQVWIGASYQAQPNVSGGMVLEGSQQTYFVDSLGSASKAEQQADLHQTYPDIIRLGLSWRPQPRLELRLFGDLQRWSVTEDQCVSPRGEKCELGPDGRGINGSVPLLNARRNWQDTFGVRLGLSYWTNQKRDLELFGGFGFDSNAVPDETLEPAIADADKPSAAAGARIGLSDSFHVAASYTHIHYLQRDNTGKSIQTELQGASQSPDAGGVYRSWVGVFNANAEITF